MSISPNISKRRIKDRKNRLVIPTGVILHVYIYMCLSRCWETSAPLVTVGMNAGLNMSSQVDLLSLMCKWCRILAHVDSNMETCSSVATSKCRYYNDLSRRYREALHLAKPLNARLIKINTIFTYWLTSAPGWTAQRSTRSRSKQWKLLSVSLLLTWNIWQHNTHSDVVQLYIKKPLTPGLQTTDDDDDDDGSDFSCVLFILLFCVFPLDIIETEVGPSTTPKDLNEGWTDEVTEDRRLHQGDLLFLHWGGLKSE